VVFLELILISYAAGMAEAGYRLVREGQARVLVRIQSSELGTLAGSWVLQGQVSKNSHVKVVRNDQVLWAGRIRRLQPAGEGGSPAPAGQRCTIAFDGFEAFQAGDSVEAFQLEPRR
jgi:translation initiation factor IF-2